MQLGLLTKLPGLAFQAALHLSSPQFANPIEQGSPVFSPQDIESSLERLVAPVQTPTFPAQAIMPDDNFYWDQQRGLYDNPAQPPSNFAAAGLTAFGLLCASGIGLAIWQAKKYGDEASRSRYDEHQAITAQAVEDYFKTRNPQTLLRCLIKINADNPREPAKIRLAIAGLKFQTQNYRSAESWLKAALEEDSHLEKAHLLLGMVQEMNGDLRNARKSYELAAAFVRSSFRYLKTPRDVLELVFNSNLDDPLSYRLGGYQLSPEYAKTDLAVNLPLALEVLFGQSPQTNPLKPADPIYAPDWIISMFLGKPAEKTSVSQSMSVKPKSRSEEEGAQILDFPG